MSFGARGTPGFGGLNFRRVRAPFNSPLMQSAGARGPSQKKTLWYALREPMKCMGSR
jgi:hypothetical protein